MELIFLSGFVGFCTCLYGSFALGERTGEKGGGVWRVSRVGGFFVFFRYGFVFYNF